MAHSPISRPDPFDPEGPSSAQESSGAGAQSLSQWVSTLSACGGGSLAADLALDLVLHDIGERARAGGNATAAAIALARDGEIVCRATTGENAPGLGVPLHSQSGLSGACVQTRKWQHCEDTELDERVDAEVCRRLGVRSILVYPILKKQEFLGIIEIFGSRPRAFGSLEIGTLEVLAREVVESVNRAAAVPSPGLEPQSMAGMESVPRTVPALAVPTRKERDLFTDALSLLVIALAVILGWVVGRAGWRSTMNNLSGRGQVAQSAGVADSKVVGSSGPQMPEQSAATTHGDDGSYAVVPENGLTIFRDGRVVFHTPAQSNKEDATSVARNITVPGLRIPPEIANEYVIRRVEPEYPESTRERRIQGPAVIDVIVGRDGEVEKLTAVRGDVRLVTAAIDAIRQWRFQPFLLNGTPEAFQTRITLDFRLP